MAIDGTNWTDIYFFDEERWYHIVIYHRDKKKKTRWKNMWIVRSSILCLKHPPISFEPIKIQLSFSIHNSAVCTRMTNNNFYCFDNVHKRATLSLQSQSQSIQPSRIASSLHLLYLHIYSIAGVVYTNAESIVSDGSRRMTTQSVVFSHAIKFQMKIRINQSLSLRWRKFMPE